MQLAFLIQCFAHIVTLRGLTTNVCCSCVHAPVQQGTCNNSAPVAAGVPVIVKSNRILLNIVQSGNLAALLCVEAWVFSSNECMGLLPCCHCCGVIVMTPVASLKRQLRTFISDPPVSFCPHVPQSRERVNRADGPQHLRSVRSRCLSCATEFGLPVPVVAAAALG